MAIYSGIHGYVSECTIGGVTVYCQQQRGVFYVTYNSAGASAPIASGQSEDDAYANWTRRYT